MKTFLRILFFYFLVTQICFAQWYQQNSGTTSTLNSIHFEDANIGWAVGDSGIILHTTNGGQDWIIQSSGTNNVLYDVCFTDTQTGWVAGGNTLLYTSNGGTDWANKLSGTTYSLSSVSFIDTLNGWVSGEDTSGGIILHTTNGGTSWMVQQDSVERYWFNKVYFTNINNGTAVGNSHLGGGFGDGGIIQSTFNGGASWNSSFSSRMFGISFIDSSTGWIVGLGETIFKTTNGGIDWISQYSSLHYYSYFFSVYFSDANNGTVVGDGGTILRTTNGGTNWIEQNCGITNRLSSVFFIDSLNGWVVGGDGTILHTNNSGIIPVELTSFTAQAENQKVVLKWVTETELNNNGFEIQRRVAESKFVTVGYVRGEGTTTNQREYSYIDRDLVDGKYFYRLKQVDYNGSYESSNVIEVDVRSLNEYALEQNFPNPFNPITTIGYVLKEKTNAKLILLNAIGEEVAVLVNEEQDKGFHTVDFNASTLASGVYFYQLQAGSFVQTRKMILLK